MAEPYRSTPIFDENSLPAALRANHETNAGVWGVIRVLEGTLTLTYADTASQKELSPGNPGVVSPQQTHFVTPNGPMRMQVDFYDEQPAL